MLQSIQLSFFSERMALIVNENEITRNQHFLFNEAMNETNFDKFSFQSAKYYYVFPSRDELMKLQKILRNSTAMSLLT